LTHPRTFSNLGERPLGRAGIVKSPSRRTARLLEFYDRYLVDHDELGFAASAAGCYFPATLERLLAADLGVVRRAAALALGMVGDYGSNEALGRALRDEDIGVRLLSEGALRDIWCRQGAPDEQAELSSLVELNRTGHHRKALHRATELIDNNARLAEAWNQRAIAHFGLGRFVESIHDCRRAISLNSFHFGAQAGLGECYLKLGNDLWALESFRRALAIHPGLDGVRTRITTLERKLRNNF
jgi:tetratricopeptide (TPR) repeat protein